MYQMGGLGNYMNTAELQAGRGEPLKDTARVLGRYYDCVVWRTYRQRDLEEFAELAGVPVINGLTDYAHPCQVLADLMTIRERRGTLAGPEALLRGRRQQHGQQPHRGRPAGRDAGDLRLPAELPPGGGCADVRPQVRQRVPPDHRPRRGRAGCRRGGHRGVEHRRPAPPESEQRLRDLWASSSPASCWKAQSPMPWCCTACPPTGARRSPPPCSSSTRRRSSTKPRTACTCRKPCWPSCWRGK